MCLLWIYGEKCQYQSVSDSSLLCWAARVLKAESTLAFSYFMSVFAARAIQPSQQGHTDTWWML